MSRVETGTHGLLRLFSNSRFNVANEPGAPIKVVVSEVDLDIDQEVKGIVKMPKATDTLADQILKIVRTQLWCWNMEMGLRPIPFRSRYQLRDDLWEMCCLAGERGISHVVVSQYVIDPDSFSVESNSHTIYALTREQRAQIAPLRVPRQILMSSV